MRKEYYNYVVKLPVLLHELFRGKVADYHFSDMTVVMNHLVKSYIRMTDGGRVSTATRRILLCMDRIPDMSFFFRRHMLLSVGLMQAYTRKADINTIPFGENLNMN